MQGKSLPRTKVLISIAVIVLVALTLLLLPEQGDEGKVQALWEKENYPAAIHGAEQVLARDAQAHEIREIAAKAYLANGQYLPALEHMLVLEEAGQPISPLNRELVRDITKFDEKDAGAALQLIVHHLQHEDKPWMLELAGVLLNRPDLAEMIPDLLVQFDLEQLSSNLSIMSLVDIAWTNVVENGSLADLWRTAVIIDESSPQTEQAPSYQMYAISMAQGEEEEWRALQAQYPDHALLALGLAQAMGGRGGLDWLQDWEAQGDVPSDWVQYYGILKIRIMEQVDILEPADLAWIDPSQIGYLTYYSSHPKRQALFQLTEKLGAEFQEHRDMIELAKNVPEPMVMGFKHYPDRITQDGWLICPQMGDGVLFINPKDGTEFSHQGQYPFWSPQHSAWYILHGGKIIVLDSHGNSVNEFTLSADITRIIGWIDDDSLLVQERRGTLFSSFNVNSGNMQRVLSMESYPHQLVLGPGGKLAWSSGKGIDVWDNGEVEHFPFPGTVHLSSWNPQGDALTLMMDGQQCVWFLDGDETLVLDLELEGGHCLGWRNSEELYFAHINHRYVQLSIYNTATDTLTPVGIYNPILAEGNRVVSQGSSGLHIYELP